MPGDTFPDGAAEPTIGGAEAPEPSSRPREPAGERGRDELLAAMIRDLHPPVAKLRAGLRAALAGRHGALPAEQRAALEALERETSRIADVERDLGELHDLSLGRAGLRRARTDLAVICGRATDGVEPLARERDVAIVREVPHFPVTVLADGERLRRALQEIVAHVVAGAPARSQVAVRLEAGAGGSRIAVERREALRSGGGEAEPPGGVALALSREIVELNGGALDLGPDRAEIWIAEEADAGGPAAAASGRARILVVEDDDISREALTEALADRYDVEPAADGVEGLEAARARRPDLVLMDLYLPRLDGFAALEALRVDPATADVPVILVSGRGDDLTRARSLDLGAIDFLQKPFSERELRARIERTLRLARRQHQLQTLAETDALTGLANRRAFRSRLSQEVKRARRYGTPLSCVMIDMDHLKPVNDRFGHVSGDRAIAALASVLRNDLRESDFAARYGGDEFVLLLPHSTAAEGRALAERVCERIRETTFEADGTRQPLQASLGVAELPPGPPEDAAEALLRNADTALYDAKNSGRGRVALWADAEHPPPIGRG